jgi:hypothetical protein
MFWLKTMPPPAPKIKAWQRRVLEFGNGFEERKGNGSVYLDTSGDRLMPLDVRWRLRRDKGPIQSVKEKCFRGDEKPERHLRHQVVL